MAKYETNPLINCEVCGEKYNAEYRHCPYCGNRTNREQEPEREQSAERAATAASRGGKRLAGEESAAPSRTGGAGAGRAAGGSAGGRSTSGSRAADAAGVARSVSRGNGPVPQARGGGSRSRAVRSRRSAFWEFWDRVGVSPVRVVGFAFTLIVIIAFFLIVTKLVLPAIGRGSVDTPANKKPNQSQSVSAEQTEEPSEQPSESPSVQPPEPTNTIPAEQTAVDFVLETKEFTISAKWPNPVKLKVSLLPAGSTGTLSFESSNPDAVGVTADGTVWATGKGSAVITVSLPGAEPQTCKVISSVAGGVPPADATPAPSTGSTSAPNTGTTSVPSGKLKLNKTEFTISNQYPHPVTITATGANGAVTWTSSNSGVASVDQQGKVTRIGKGKCTITATDAAGNTATCTVRCS